VTDKEAADLLAGVKQGTVSVESALRAFQAPPVQDLGFASVDTHRSLRKGFPEVIFGAGKTAHQIVEIGRKLLERENQLLITRVSHEQAEVILKGLPSARHHAAARCVTVEKEPLPKKDGVIAVLSAGTSDLAVAEEAALTAEIMGNVVKRIHDIGVAGLHRLLRRLEEIQQANVIIVVAGMEGALPSVVAGLVSKPLIAVPTSVGYGASFGGLAALLGMLNSCGSGVTVVNIDNGFGAGYAAAQINALGGR